MKSVGVALRWVCTEIVTRQQKIAKQTENWQGHLSESRITPMTRNSTDRYEVCNGTLIDTRLPVLRYDSPANPAPQSPTSFLSVFLRVICVIRDSDSIPPTGVQLDPVPDRRGAGVVAESRAGRLFDAAPAIGFNDFDRGQIVGVDRDKRTRLAQPA